MKTLHCFGLSFALVLSVAVGCSDDDASSSSGAAGDSPAGGEPNAAAGSTSEGGAENEGGGAPGGAGDAAGGTAGTPSSAGAGGVMVVAGAGGEGGTMEALAASTVLNVQDVKTHPEEYTWFDFRPNVKKLILAGAAETEHIAILWYTVADGGVGLHYHSKTESVYVIDGTQTDAKGVYANGTVYFNPPGSGHQITDSGGFFLLAYAAPPDFTNTNLIEEYTPIRIDTTAPDLTTTYPFAEKGEGIGSYLVPLAELGGLKAELIETSSSATYPYVGNYVLVLKGSCDVEGVTLEQGMLVVAKSIVPQAYGINATANSTCLAMGVSF